MTDAMADRDPRIEEIVAKLPKEPSPEEQDVAWRQLVAGPLSDPSIPFNLHWDAWMRVFMWRPADVPPPAAYEPSPERVARAHVTALARDVGVEGYAALHRWTVENRDAFWQRTIDALGIPFADAPKAMRAQPDDAEHPQWLPGARLNIADACFTAPSSRTAIVLGREGGDDLERVTYGELARLVDRVAHGFREAGLEKGDAVALYMPMTVACVAAYLGVIKAGGAVVSIADSFAPPEVATRLRLSKAKLTITTSAFARGGKTFDLYVKAREAGAGRCVVIPGDGDASGLREHDLFWDDFLGADAAFESVTCDPYDVTNILFSSGTTGEPKAIPWTHLTPIKAAADARYHHDVHGDDVVAWPTSIGWMMGPWLVYASLVNGATMALYEGAPNGPGFTRFVEDAQVTMLGLVPALVRAWRTTGATADRDWTHVKTFSSTGEASNVEDYLWLMHLTGYRAPVVEYCGGTEIGGGHITGTTVQPQSPATFSTPALGVDVVVLDEENEEVEAGDMGEIYLVPPSIGLSESLLNRDHHEIYYAGAPRDPNGETLRRHGDEIAKLGGGYYQAQGRADDTMNLGGIKVASLELERVMDHHPDVYQSAAVAVVPPGGGAERLVAFVVPAGDGVDTGELRKGLQARIKEELNPLFRIHDVVLVDALPRTASNKVMRRELRAQYKE